MTIFRCIRHNRPSEEGYMLAALTLMVALLVMSMSVAVPKVREDIQRAQEIEAMHRGQQYVRAIQLYYRKFHTYPPSVDALENTGEVRFLRRRYTDPITGKDDWQPIHFGQNKLPTIIGFFGEPLGPGGVPAAAVGLSSGNSTAGDSQLGSGSNDSGGNSAAGASLTGQTFGGGGIIGFSPTSTKQSILIYKTKDHYNEWEFVYDPLADMNMRGLIISQPNPGPPPNAGSPGFNPGFNPGSAWSNPGASTPPHQAGEQQ
jgi:type II secretory pathway pseudopilin PulG